MFEKWRTARTRSTRGAESGVREESSASVAPSASSGDAWRALPPVQRVLAAGPRTVAEYGFSASLATHWNPSFQSDLGHGAVPDAPGGVMLDAVRAVPSPVGREPAGRSEGTELPGLRLPLAGAAGSGPGAAPAVQRVPATPPVGRPAPTPRPVRGEAVAAPVRGGGAAREAGNTDAASHGASRAASRAASAASGAPRSALPAVRRAAVATSGPDDRVAPAPAPMDGAAGMPQSSDSSTRSRPVQPAPVRRSPLVSARPVQPPRQLAPVGAPRRVEGIGRGTAPVQRTAASAPTPENGARPSEAPDTAAPEPSAAGRPQNVPGPASPGGPGTPGLTPGTPVQRRPPVRRSRRAPECRA